MSRRMLVIGAHSADFVWRAGGAVAVTTANRGVARVVALPYGGRGAASALVCVVSGVCQTLAGFAVDRFGARRALLAGLALCSAGMLLAGLAHHYPVLILASLVAGVGNSVFHPADFAILNGRVDAPRLGYAFSFHGVGGNLGWALAPLFSVGLSAAYGWHAALLAAAVLGIVMIGVLLTQREAITVELRRPATGAPAPVRSAGASAAWAPVPSAVAATVSADAGSARVIRRS